MKRTKETCRRPHAGARRGVGKCERSSWHPSNPPRGGCGERRARVMHHARRPVHPAHPDAAYAKGEKASGGSGACEEDGARGEGGR